MNKIKTLIFLTLLICVSVIESKKSQLYLYAQMENAKTALSNYKAKMRGVDLFGDHKEEPIVSVIKKLSKAICNVNETAEKLFALFDENENGTIDEGEGLMALEKCCELVAEPKDRCVPYLVDTLSEVLPDGGDLSIVEFTDATEIVLNQGFNRLISLEGIERHLFNLNANIAHLRKIISLQDGDEGYNKFIEGVNHGFNMLDLDGDEEITLEEAGEALEEIGNDYGLTEEDFHNYDLDGSGSIDKEEFANFVRDGMRYVVGFLEHIKDDIENSLAEYEEHEEHNERPEKPEEKPEKPEEKPEKPTASFLRLKKTIKNRK